MIRRLLAALVLAALLVPAGAFGATDRSRQGWFMKGECTWLAYNKRPDIVNYGAEKFGYYHWDAWEWSGHAKVEGYSVNRKPKKGDIAVWQGGVAGAGPVGHLAYVRAIYTKGRIGIVEMNWNGIKSPHRRTLYPGTIKKLQFIHHGPGG